MEKEDEELCKWIQLNSQSKVTGNFLTTLRKLAKSCEGDADAFIAGCKALGKFNQSEDFLPRLFVKIKGTTNNALSTARKPMKVSSSRFRSVLPLGTDDESDEEMVVKPIRGLPQLKEVSFKRIERKEANRLKSYAEPEQPQKAPKEIHSPTKNVVEVPKLQTYLDESSYHDRDPVLSGDHSESAEESDYLSSGSQVLVEEREWYNNDDDYGNPVPDEIGPGQELDFKGTNRRSDRYVHRTDDILDASIQLYPLPLAERKQLIPQFLRRYGVMHGISESVIVGSLLESSQQGIVSPFQNPESTFSINARRGSRLVALKRLQKDQKDKARETAQIAGTVLGDVLGVRDKQTLSSQEHESFKDKSASREEIDKIRKSLPAYTVKAKLVQTIQENQVTIVIGETGSGKTTQLPQYLFDGGFCSGGKLIACTQPRRVAAMSVAKRVASEMGVKLGEEVGYSIRFEDETSDKTLIKFMTDGILLREALLDPTLDRYGCIIIDEAHERSLNTEVMLGLLKRLLARRRDLKVVVTSATMNAAKFANFFGNAPQFDIPGRTFPVQLIYSKYPVEDYVEAAVMQAVRIHASTETNSGDILIFMTGQEDVEVTAEVIRERLTDIYAKSKGIARFEEIDDVKIFTVYSALPGDIQNEIFHSLSGNKRKIVVATNIAETSLTIDGVRHVIDCGYSKLKVYNPRIGLDSLVVSPISLANANQRSGRAGRTAPGTAYRLYTEETAFEDMYAQAIPEIQRTNLSNTVLLLKSLGVDEVTKFPFVDPPPIQTLLSSLNELFFIGALDKGGNLTTLGSEMAKFPLQPSLCKILLSSAQNGCSQEMVTIVSMLSVPQIFYRPKERQKESDAARSRFFVPESDHLTLLNVYSQWKSSRYSHRWCSKHFINFKSLQRAREIRRQLVKIMQKNHITLISTGTDWHTIRKCICSGYAHQAAKVAGLGKYTSLRTGMELQLHPTSALYGLGDLPPYVVYHELLMTTKEYICCVTSVDPFWLMEYGTLLYDIKKVNIADIVRHPIEYNICEEDAKDQEKDNEIDRKLQALRDAKDLMIRELNVDIAEPDGTPVNIQKKKRTNSVQVGFKRRRPFP
ncbi:hypothetical protein HG536_0H02420 [Torulaspora globosa]|uniref:RNA helicase n=1 Tax=Torulaspora globosa TaxID=48254 RepID=A0A7G3ZMY1_9SACH|nr:uncharacterized protein HG536_0H02420 [Torulaspora globosa]QLL34867.1 hypothetical protein HG536_0H02420 [Torulaspora globosa]